MGTCGLVGFSLPEPGKHEVFAILALDSREASGDDDIT